MTFWLGDDGAGGVVFLHGGVVLEVRAQSVYGGNQRCGEKGGGLVDDLSLRCPWRRKAVRRRASHLLGNEGGGLVGPYASCDHEVGEEVGVGGAHRVGDVPTWEVVSSRFALRR